MNKYIADLTYELKEIKENMQNNDLVKYFTELLYSKYILTIIGFLILYFFYQLGYLFLYGFYFGGDGQSSIFNIIINPIPFNFKSIIGAGIFLLIYLLLLCMPLVISIFDKFNIEVFIIIIVISVIIILSVEYMFLGNIIITQPLLPTTILGTPIGIFYMIYAMKNFQTYFKLTIINVMYFFMLIAIFNSFMYIELSSNNYAMEFVVLIFYTFAIVPQINKKINKFKSEKKRIVIKWIGIILGIILVYRCNIEKSFISFGYFIITIHTEKIGYKIVSILSDKINWYFHKSDKHKEPKYKKVTNICVGIVIIIIIYPILGSGIITYGSYIGDLVMKNNSTNQISYEFNKDNKSSEEIYGTIVAQDGDTYYISQLPERKLAIIKSKSIIVE